MSRKQPQQTFVNLSRLKKFAEKLPHGWVLRDIILGEEDRIPAVEFCLKLPLWLKLLKRGGEA